MSFELTLDEGKFLAKIARRAIATYLEKGRKITAPHETPAKLREKCGVFVTLNKIVGGKEELRGCIGFPLPEIPLIDATIDAAISAAVNDSRFPRVTSQELKDVVLEVSVLTPPVLIEVNDPKSYIEEVKVGQDGLIVERGWFKGLLLPQVPTEWKWDAEEFLANCCMKAGLTPDTWLIKGTKIYKFSCIIAQELSPNGTVKIIDMRKGDKQ
ncbi:MAG: TIGR00296 family protein [Candidatus Bathyarchaeota archaeon]